MGKMKYLDKQAGRASTSFSAGTSIALIIALDDLPFWSWFSRTPHARWMMVWKQTGPVSQGVAFEWATDRFALRRLNSLHFAGEAARFAV